jgi:hypothetical protein
MKQEFCKNCGEKLTDKSLYFFCNIDCRKEFYSGQSKNFRQRQELKENSDTCDIQGCSEKATCFYDSKSICKFHYELLKPHFKKGRPSLCLTKFQIGGKLKYG